MENQTTVRQVVEDVIDILNSISIPVALFESIGTPIKKSISGLQLCIDAWDKEEKAANKEPLFNVETFEEVPDKEEPGNGNDNHAE